MGLKSIKDMGLKYIQMLLLSMDIVIYIDEATRLKNLRVLILPGRLAIYDDKCFKNELFNIFGHFGDFVGDVTKNYNIAPTTNIPIFLNNRNYTYAHFGLIPSWAKDKKSININGRGETLFEKKSFRESFKSKRCIIPINGYFEWEKDKDKKTSKPHIIKSSKENFLALAGLWDEWYDIETSKYLLSCALITTQPNEKVEVIHDRMPVVLDKKDWKKWLDNDTSLIELNKLFKSCDNDILEISEVSDVVNKVKNNTIECILPPMKKENELFQTTLF
jgi:putative SOS response-associated peptidase YedK